MAYRVGRPQLTEIVGRKALGVTLPFNGPGVFNSSYETVAAYKANILNYFLTSKGERYLNPAFGSEIGHTFGNNIAEYLFEPMVEERLSSLKSDIVRDLKVYFPRIQIYEFEITPDPDNQIIQLYLRFGVQNLTEEGEITVNYS